MATHVLSAAHRAQHRGVRSRTAGLENSLHPVRDVALREDASQIREQPGIFARLRSWALNLIRISGAQHIYATRQTLGWDAQAAWNCLTAHDEK
ncbi:MAG: hypothetical protein JWM42_3458 [Burkholderia sp.]|nr:hypothetical protein [Burkholderia sp.]